jgi:hypothetical protein
MKNVSSACQKIPDFTTESSSKSMFSEKSAGWSRKGSTIEFIAGHYFNGSINGRSFHRQLEQTPLSFMGTFLILSFFLLQRAWYSNEFGYFCMGHIDITLSSLD